MALRSPPRDPVDAEDQTAARLAAVALLTRRDYSTGELSRKLTERGFAAAATQAALAHLVAAGLVNELRFVESYIRSHCGRGQGPARIGADLRKSGVPDALIEQGLNEVDWVELARKVRRAKFGTLVPKDWVAKARQARFLQYRGFSADHIRAATGADPEFE